MTLRRVVALAQALTLITLLMPGPDSLGPAIARAAVAPSDPGSQATNVFDANGRGIGCQPRSARFRGPQPPRDPPWPPGAEPTPSPSPEPSPAHIPSPGPVATTEPPASLEAEPSPGPATAFLQSQASTPPEVADPSGSDADITPDVPSRRGRARRGYVRGIDVSHHNDDIDFVKVRRAGYDFVFIKATQDNDFVDPMFLSNVAKAKAAGLATGGYHFFDYSLDGKVQADHFVDRLELADAVGDALPPVVDVECWAPIGSSIHAVSAARLRDFVARVYERTGRLPIVYTSVYMWSEVMGDADGFGDLPLWAACWGCGAPPSIAQGWDSWAFWQTGTDRVRGVKRLDGNVFSGTREDLYALRLRPLALEGGARATSSQRVAVDLGGRDATHLRTSQDGVDWSNWRPVRGTPSAPIGDTEGSHTVYVQLRHGAGRPSPVYTDSIELDLTGPVLTTPTARLGLGPVGDPDAMLGDESADPAVPIEVSWQASDEPAGLDDATVVVTCGAASEERHDVPGVADPGVVAPWSAAVAVTPGATCRISVEASDGAGNTTQATLLSVEAVIHASADGGMTGLTVDADQVGVIAQRGPGGGQAAVHIDGEPVASVDLSADAGLGPEVVYVADLVPGAPRTISIAPSSGTDPASSGARIDGFVTLATGSPTLATG